MSRRSRAKCDMRSARNANSRNAETAKDAEVFAKGAKKILFMALLFRVTNYCAFVVPMIYQSAPTTMIW